MEQISFKLSEKAEISQSAYVARIESIKDIEPIEGSVKLVKVMVAGYPVITDNSIKKGDVVLFFPVASAINESFLGANNLFELSSCVFNANSAETLYLIEESNKESKEGNIDLANKLKLLAKNKCGLFSKNGKVRCIKLMQTPSQGFIIPMDAAFKAWKPDIEIDVNKYVGTVFDTVVIQKDSESESIEISFCQKFIPMHIKKMMAKAKKEGNRVNKRLENKNKSLKKFDKLIEGQFSFHTKPGMLNVNMHQITPETIVQISSKWHGTSYIDAKILCKRKLSIFDKIKLFFKCDVKKYQYDSVYSSSGVIRNQFINPTQNQAYYSVNIYKAVNDILYPYLDDGMIAYGEAVGYLPESDTMIQTGYDYGCEAGKFKIIIYRLVHVDAEGNTTEYNSQAIKEWVRSKVGHMDVQPFTAVHEYYYGKMGDLYPDIEKDDNWNINVLKRLMNDKRFFMEEDCQFCKNKVPTEGIILRVEDGQNLIKCFKLKTNAFYIRENKQLDCGEIDIETLESEQVNQDCDNI